MLNKKAEVEHIKENIPTNKRISHKISTEKKENESGIIIDVTEQINHPITNQNISDSQNTSHNNEVKTDPTSIIKKNLPNQNLEFTKHTATIFSQAMEIPESLLGQEIFPRKYLAIFQLNRSTNQELTSVEFLGLSPQSDSLTYVDKTLFTHFKKHFNLLEKIKILEYFKQYSDNPVNIVLIFTEN